MIVLLCVCEKEAIGRQHNLTSKTVPKILLLENMCTLSNEDENWKLSKIIVITILKLWAI